MAARRILAEQKRQTEESLIRFRLQAVREREAEEVKQWQKDVRDRDDTHPQPQSSIQTMIPNLPASIQAAYQILPVEPQVCGFGMGIIPLPEELEHYESLDPSSFTVADSAETATDAAGGGESGDVTARSGQQDDLVGVFLDDDDDLGIGPLGTLREDDPYPTHDEDEDVVKKAMKYKKSMSKRRKQLAQRDDDEPLEQLDEAAKTAAAAKRKRPPRKRPSGSRKRPGTNSSQDETDGDDGRSATPDSFAA